MDENKVRVYDGWNFVLSVCDIVESYGRDKNVFPPALHPNPDEIIPDSIIPWLKHKKEDSKDGRNND